MMRIGWTLRAFDSVEEADEAARVENLGRGGVERIRILTAISTPDAERREPGFPGPHQILDGPAR